MPYRYQSLRFPLVSYRRHESLPICNCGEPLKEHERVDGICFYCKELENNRRYRQHNHQEI